MPGIFSAPESLGPLLLTRQGGHFFNSPRPGPIDGVVYTDGKMLPPDASGLILTLGRGHPPFYLASELRDHS